MSTFLSGISLSLLERKKEDLGQPYTDIVNLAKIVEPIVMKMASKWGLGPFSLSPLLFYGTNGASMVKPH